MPEPTLSMRVEEIQAEVGVYFGWGRGAYYQDRPWKRDQFARIHSCVKSGLRRFYWPEPVPPLTQSYDWSFLKPVAEIAFPDNTKYVTLPDDFGSPEGYLTITNAVTQTVWAIELTGIGLINHNYQVLPTTVGRPLMAAITPLRGDNPQQSQQWQLWIWPITDQAYTFQLQYYINPNYLTGDTPYAYGGSQHHETILEACLSVAEERVDDMAPMTGPHGLAFKQRLAASISVDRRLKPQKLGANRDRSDDTDGWDRSALHWLASVAYNGNPL